MLKNIVVIADETSVTNGGADVAVNTAYLMAQKGFSVYYFSASGEKIAPVDERLLSSPNIKIIALGQYPIRDNPSVLKAMYQGFYNFTAQNALRQLLRTLNPEETVIHVHAWVKILSPSIFKPIIDMHFKMFITVHDYLLACPCSFPYNYPAQKICELPAMSMKCILSSCDRRKYIHKLWKFFRNIIQNRLLRKAPNTGYIFISEFSRRQLLRRIDPPKNQFMLPNLVQISSRFRAEAEKNTLFLFLGRLSPEKGIRHFCEAIRSTHSQGLVIGDGDLKPQLQAQYPEITFTGWLNRIQILEHFRKTRCLIFPSLWYEVCPLVPIEAKAYGIPVIASDCSAASDGADFVYHSQEELEALIMKVSHENIEPLSRTIYQNFDEGMTEHYADNLLEIYSAKLD
ncbi:MAG: glycosyltransferase family 4 protein [Synergistaceae bacterium]|nr:glycosyltransferase family 4 protein [Synergistaceae bacterium]